ncbi:MAG: hypothetical protein Q7J31_04555 [Syntrophales bacterium]|nr:hypothetical protein [Syntrophales bacterium]
MQEIIHSSEESLLESMRHEILAEDIVKKLRPSLEQYAVEVRRFVRESMVRGFDRNMILYSTAVFEKEIKSIITMAEESLHLSQSAKIKILGSELQGIKDFITVFVETTKKIIMEEPNSKQQMVLERRGK